MRSVPGDQKAAAGKLVGQARGRVNQALAAREAEIVAAEAAAQLAAESRRRHRRCLDAARAGARHPLTLLQERVADIFVGMGWEVAEGPELENEWFNFDALNFDADHPARAMQDTFFIDPVERAPRAAHAHVARCRCASLLERELPVYVLAPGRVYRTDELDATHTPGLHTSSRASPSTRASPWRTCAARSTTSSSALFGDEAKIRLRPNYFPFTEPSAELDLWHPTFKGGARWIEWGGCGMVNPNVLRAAGIDPEVYSGLRVRRWASSATLMFRNDVKDMRDMVEGDVRFSQQFGMVV